MKDIIPSLNKLQLALQDRRAPLSDIGVARQALLAGIKEAVSEAIKVGGTKQNSAIEKFMEKFNDQVMGIKK